MNSYDEKISLLTEMIAFAIVDGKLHDREYQFLSIVAAELRIPKDTFKELFHHEIPLCPIKSEFQRIQQFYRLALLMHVDGVLHQKEEIAIQQIAVNMGLNPNITRRVLKMLKESPAKFLAADMLLEVFREQHN